MLDTVLRGCPATRLGALCPFSSPREKEKGRIGGMMLNTMPCFAPNRATAPAVGGRPRSGRKHCQQARAVLSRDQLDTFYQKGYLVVDDFASPAQVTAMMDSSDNMLSSYQPDQATVYSVSGNKPVGEQYWLDSASNISFFMEEDALGEDGKLNRDQSVAVNKVGHAMHDIDPAFRSYSRGPKVQELLADLGYKDPLPVQSMLFCKNSHTGAEVIPHQDSSYLYTDPPSVVGLWLALQDATIENGCLHCLPGSHTNGVFRRLVNRPQEGGVHYVGDTEWDERQWDFDTFEPVEVKAGSLLLLHGSNVHFSKDNTSPNPRRAYALHIVEGADGHQWQEDNWVARKPDFPFEPLYGSKS